jgi:hypothetical protein
VVNVAAAQRMRDYYPASTAPFNALLIQLGATFKLVRARTL